jgi:hypothetical protein
MKSAVLMFRRDGLALYTHFAYLSDPTCQRRSAPHAVLSLQPIRSTSNATHSTHHVPRLRSIGLLRTRIRATFSADKPSTMQALEALSCSGQGKSICSVSFRRPVRIRNHDNTVAVRSAVGPSFLDWQHIRSIPHIASCTQMVGRSRGRCC